MSKLSDDDCARAVFEALDGRHAEDAAACLDEATLLHVSGSSGLAGDYQGEEVILQLFSRMATLTGGSLRCGPSTSTSRAGGAWAAHGSLVAERCGHRLETAVEVVVHAERGTAREIWISDLHEPAFDDFWSSMSTPA